MRKLLVTVQPDLEGQTEEEHDTTRSGQQDVME